LVQSVSIAFRRFPSPAHILLRERRKYGTGSPLPFGVFRLRLVAGGGESHRESGTSPLPFGVFRLRLPAVTLQEQREERRVSIAFRRFPSPARRGVDPGLELDRVQSPLPFGVFRLRLGERTYETSNHNSTSLHCLSAFSVSGSRIGTIAMSWAMSLASPLPFGVFRLRLRAIKRSTTLRCVANGSPLPFGVFRLRLNRGLVP